MTALIAGVYGLFMGVMVVLFWRNQRVFRYRGEVLDRVSDLARADIYAGRAWKWRFEELDQVSYNRMVLMVWRPFDSFYEGSRCLIPGEAGEG